MINFSVQLVSSIEEAVSVFMEIFSPCGQLIQNLFINLLIWFVVAGITVSLVIILWKKLAHQDDHACYGYDQADDKRMGRDWERSNMTPEKVSAIASGKVVLFKRAIIAIIIPFFLGSVVLASNPPMENDYTISVFTDQPQYIQEAKRGELLFHADGSPYILYWQEKGGFKEYFFSDFPEELSNWENSEKVMGKEVSFIVDGWTVKEWGFTDPSIRVQMDQYSISFFGE